MRIVVFEVHDHDSDIFDKIMEIVEAHPDIECLRVKDKPMLELLLNYNIKIVELTAQETLKLKGLAETDILKMNAFVDENTMIRLADNGSNVDVLAEIFKGLL